MIGPLVISLILAQAPADAKPAPGRPRPFVIAFVWLISQGGLDWGPVRRMRRFAVVDEDRTSETTIRRVGLEGREDVA